MTSPIREPAAESETPTQRLASIILGRDVAGYIAEKRKANRTWRLIARDLYDDTNGQIDVTYETLRLWNRGQQ